MLGLRERVNVVAVVGIGKLSECDRLDGLGCARLPTIAGISEIENCYLGGSSQFTMGNSDSSSGRSTNCNSDI